MGAKEARVELAAQIVDAYVSHNQVNPRDLQNLIRETHAALAGAAKAGDAATETRSETQKPAVSIKKFIAPERISCLGDGKQFKSLKRHLGVEHGLMPQQYRAKWGLSKDYPMVARSYSEARSSLARDGAGPEASQS